MLSDKQAIVKQLQREKELRAKEMKNMNAKYDTKNPLTRLYDQVDEYYSEQKSKK